MGGRNWGSPEALRELHCFRSGKRDASTTLRMSAYGSISVSRTFLSAMTQKLNETFFSLFFFFHFLSWRALCVADEATRDRIARPENQTYWTCSWFLSFSLSLSLALSLFFSISRVLNDKSPMRICGIAPKIARWKFAAGHAFRQSPWLTRSKIDSRRDELGEPREIKFAEIEKETHQAQRQIFRK